MCVEVIVCYIIDVFFETQCSLLLMMMACLDQDLSDDVTSTSCHCENCFTLHSWPSIVTRVNRHRLQYYYALPSSRRH